MTDTAYLDEEPVKVASPELLRELGLAGAKPARTRGMLTRARLVRRALVLSDVIALAASGMFVIGVLGNGAGARPLYAYLGFLAALPLWIVAAQLYGLYSFDHVRADHSTADEVPTILSLTSFGSLLLGGTSWVFDRHTGELPRILVFWLLATALLTVARGTVRPLIRRRSEYLQNTIIVGAGNIGQLVARKILNHPEYRINLVGLLDDNPVERRDDLEHLALLGGVERLPELVELLAVERVIVAFSNDSEEETIGLIRSLRDLGLQIDIVPRLFEVVGPAVGIHTVEGLPLVGVPSIDPSRGALLAKRCVDLVLATILLVLTAPLVVVVAWRIKRDSPGPVFFRQVRLGRGRKPFTMLKFRTMHSNTSTDEHRAYVTAAMSEPASTKRNGLFKPDRAASLTRVGRWLRHTSLDELPQLWNVLAGDMSLVGPRPCIPYELELFEPHHFDRFLVPAGLTGLWQVSARAKSSFSEALDLDAEYARGWSFWLDLRLLLRTPLHLVRPGATR